MSDANLDLIVPRLVQPDDVSCGPTCLSSVLRFHGHPEADLHEVIARTPTNPGGGTLAPHLGLAGLRFGMAVRLWPFAVQVFDPTWRDLDANALLARLEARLAGLPEGRLRRVHAAWRDFLAAGGEVRLGEVGRAEMVAALDAGNPLIVGLSVTWLYQEARERPADNQPDDVAGAPVGHFVVVTGYDAGGEDLLVADPWPHPPFGDGGRYRVSERRLMHAILLGDATHDAVVVEVHPRPGTSF
jgi:Peptidase_C39 like family